MISVNPRLAKLFARRLLRFFDSPLNQGTLIGDPWWWPAGDAQTVDCWGLDPVKHARHASSLWGRTSPQPDFDRLGTFPGSVAATDGAIMIITTRPSRGPWPPRKSELSRLVNQFTRVFSQEELATGVHVTDLLKFRGNGPDSEARNGLSEEQWRSSIYCLLEEVQLLQPTCLLVSLNAATWIQHLCGGKGVRPRSAGAVLEDTVQLPKETIEGLRSLRGSSKFRAVPGLYDQVNAQGKAMAWLTALGRSGGPRKIG